ncbi:MAG TPA: response regulator [Pyrinomonadaceae bacterium]|jgi:DNA-binding response OmpR family regulator|nr:response regulator [Pyrinomonadaceae bacterium]
MFSSEQPQVLYLESDDDTRILIKMMLEQSGFRVTAITDDEQCLEQVEKNQYDLILLEHTSFGLSGLTLCSTIRETALETPILFFSSRAFPKDKAAALQAGAQSYLVKPNDLSRLTHEVSRLIRERETVQTH